jgi:hypothetical protein
MSPTLDAKLYPREPIVFAGAIRAATFREAEKAARRERRVFDRTFDLDVVGVKFERISGGRFAITYTCKGRDHGPEHAARGNRKRPHRSAGRSGHAARS